MKIHFTRPFSRPHGFTLIITLSLMFLLVILALGMLSLSSTTLRSSASSSHTLKARQNARMALMLAIGQLQLHTGPDQRITATANIAGDDLGNPLAPSASPSNANSVNGSNKGLSSVQPGTRHWTGVWRNLNPNPLVEGFTTTPSPTLLQWLVSGNESRSAADRIVPADASFTVNPSGLVTDPSRAVVLVGTRTAAGNDPHAADRYVAAPLVEIRETNTNQISGRYAWWIGDEGVKASINIPETRSNDNRYASLLPQRRGWEAVAGLNSYPTASSPNHNNLSRVSSIRQAELLLPDAVTSLRSHFHATTTDSLALLTDPLQGGTKIDLTAVFAQPLTSSPPANAQQIPHYPRQGGQLIPAIANLTDRLQAPLWDSLHAFHQQRQGLTSSSLEVRNSNSPSQPAVAPLILDLRLLLGARIRLSPPPTPPDTAQRYRVHPCAKVAIALANPYTLPMRWNQDLILTLRREITTPQQAWPIRIKTHFGGTNLNDRQAFVLRNDPWNMPAFFPRDSNEPSVLHNLSFRIPAGTLAPGAAMAYTLSAPVLRDPLATTTGSTTVTLAPFTSADPSNFSHCIEMSDQHLNYHPRIFNFAPDPFTGTAQNISVYSPTVSTIACELSLAGAPTAPPLRSIRGANLTIGGTWTAVNRGMSPAQVRALTQPFPLMLYRYQISQPGIPYSDSMPAGFASGQRGGTLRTYADFNLAACHFPNTLQTYSPAPYFMLRSDSKALLDTSAAGGNTGTGFTQQWAIPPLRWGHSPFASERTTLFTVPSDFAALAQWQHADLTGDETAASISYQPGHAFANSYATPFVKRHLSTEVRNDVRLAVTGTFEAQPTNQPRRYFDLSYLLNASLWDAFFLSTIRRDEPQALPLAPLYRVNSGAPRNELNDPILAANHLQIVGAFNVNSTEKNAWKAHLASAKHRAHPAAAATPQATFPRSLEQSSAASSPPSGSDADSFTGFRQLDDSQLDQLAEEITRQVRLRGPFLSLSHFVNRALAPITTHPALSRSGALQSAIDESGLNINLSGNRCVFTNLQPNTDRLNLSADANSTPVRDVSDQLGSIASIAADPTLLTTHKQEQGYRSTGIPGWLTQADLLQVIGPSLTARSDTFRIRAYGECLDSQGRKLAHAYCEATVQRSIEYIDPSNPPEARQTPSAPETLSPLNQRYGRRFYITSFHWLEGAEI